MKAFTQLVSLVAAATSVSALFLPESLCSGYQPPTSDHFYTTDALEMENAVANLGYQSEGDAGLLFPTQVAFTTPLYRAYSQSAVDHFYTASSDEKNNAVANLGYADENIAGYITPIKF
ncbi:hypothetical protein CPB85DRAFT_1284797, partial [Mucidula mucida]